VSEQFLHGADVGAALEQMRSKRMTEHVRRHAFVDPGRGRCHPHCALKYAVGQVMPPAQAGLASVLVAVTPPTIYGAYFTPEAAYIFMFWVFSAGSLAALEALAEQVTIANPSVPSGSHVLAMGSGALGGIAFLIKPHAAALGMAYVASVVVLMLAGLARPDDRKRRRGGEWASLGLAVLNIGAFAAGAVFTVLLVGRILGDAWLAAFDVKLYSTLISHSTQTTWRSMNVGPIATLMVWHVAAIVAALALPNLRALTLQRCWFATPRRIAKLRERAPLLTDVDVQSY
jgi:hypothetical protein